MSAPESAEDAVYIGDDWLLYAARTLRFDQSECVAPCALVGSADPGLRLTMGDGRKVCEPVVLHAAGVWSALDEPAAGTVLYLDPLAPAGAALQRRCAQGVFPWPAQGALQQVRERIPLLCEGRGQPEELDRLVAQWSEEILGPDQALRQLDPRLLRLRHWLLTHNEGRVDVRAMAEMTGLSTDHLRQHFRRQVGMTVSSYLAWARLFAMSTLACEAHVNAQRKDAVALMQTAGFYDASHASKAIRRYFDLRPSEMLAPGCFVDLSAERYPAPIVR